MTKIEVEEKFQQAVNLLKFARRGLNDARALPTEEDMLASAHLSSAASLLAIAEFLQIITSDFRNDNQTLSNTPPIPEDMVPCPLCSDKPAGTLCSLCRGICSDKWPDIEEHVTDTYETEWSAALDELRGTDADNDIDEE